MACAILVSAALTLAVDIPSGEIEVRMLDDTVVRGRVLVKTPTHLYLQARAGARVRLLVEDIVSAKRIKSPVTPDSGPGPTTTTPATPDEPAAYRRTLAEMNPTTADAWAGFGRWCFANGFPAQGRRALEKSAVLDSPNARRRRMELADLLVTAGRRYDAQAVLAALVRACPEDAALRKTFNQLSDVLDKEIDDLAGRVKSLYRAQAYGKVLDALEPKVRGAPAMLLETLSVKVEREAGLPLDEMMATCRLKTPCPRCKGKSATCPTCHGIGWRVGGVTDYERPLLLTRLEREAARACQAVPSHVMMRLTDPRYQRPPYNRSVFVLARAQRNQYVKAFETARLRYRALLGFQAKADAAARAALQARLGELDAAIAALKKAKVR